MQCTNCGGADFSSEGGAWICNACGVVAEENNIVSEVTFIEGAGGGSSVVGQFVPSTGGKGFHRGVPGLVKESREQTIENARRRIGQVAGTLKLSQHHVEAAQRLFLLAIQHNFIQGRKTQNVVAACLYIVCRREKTPHMLIDFSDVLQTNVYVLGHTFLRFCRLLNLQLPLIDPSLYIQRFAARMEFEGKAHQVANTALRIVSRMRRDWLQTGRRPAGICGAGLLIAARLHGFRRTQKDVLHVVRVCNVTLQKRLNEFEETPSGFLTPQEFDTVDLDGEADPPAFTRLRQREEAQRLKQEEEEAAAGRTPSSSSAVAGSSDGAAAAAGAGAGDDEEQQQLEQEMAAALASSEARAAEQDLSRTLSTGGTRGTAAASSAASSSAAAALPDGATSTADAASLSSAASPDRGSDASPPASSGSRRSYSTAPPVVVRSSASSRQRREDAGPGGEESLSDIDDDEISLYLNTDEEAKVKDELWTAMNQDWLRRQAERQREEQTKQQHAAGSSSSSPGGSSGVKRKSPAARRDRSGGGPMPPAETAADAAAEMLRRRVSSKINYAALEGLFAIDDRLTAPPEKFRRVSGSQSARQQPNAPAVYDEYEETYDD